MSKLDLTNLSTGDIIRGEVGVIEASIRAAANGNYLSMTVTDGTTQQTAKIWQYNRGIIPQIGTIITVVGTVTEYKGNKDLNCKNWIPAEGDINEYRKSSVQEVEVLWDTLVHLTSYINDVSLRENICILLDKNIDTLKTHPAAKGVHHDYVGGLIHHIIEVTTIAMDIANRLKEVNTLLEINIDHVIAGALLHDIGKLRSYGWEGISPVMTNTGKFNDHIVEGIQLLTEEQFCPTWLIHIVASHHGKLEYGSPILPATLEAYIVSEADMISSKAAIFIEEMKSGSGWTDKKNFFLGRNIYRS